jgi:hypothetical protein
MGKMDPDNVLPTEREADRASHEAHGATAESYFMRKTWVWVLLLLTEVLALGGFAYVLGQVTTLACDRVGTDQIDCRIQSKWLDLLTLRDQFVRDVRGARVAENCDEDGCTYRVELVTRAGVVPLTSHYSLDSTGKEHVAQRINDFASGSVAPSLAVRDQFGRPMLIVLAAVVAVPLLEGLSWLWWRHRIGTGPRT